MKKKISASRANKRLLADLIGELKGLRLVFNEIAERYSIRVNGRFAEILRILEKEKVGGERLYLPSDKACRSMLKKARSADIRPKKARMKDMSRITQVVSAISKAMPRQP